MDNEKYLAVLVQKHASKTHPLQHQVENSMKWFLSSIECKKAQLLWKRSRKFKENRMRSQNNGKNKWERRENEGNCIRKDFKESKNLPIKLKSTLRQI